MVWRGEGKGEIWESTWREKSFWRHLYLVFSQKVGANPRGRPVGQAQDLPVPQVIEKILYLLTGALGRCCLLSAAGYFEGMRRQLLQVCRLSVDFADSGGHPSLEALLPAQLVAALSRTFFPLEREEIVAAVREAVGLFQQVAKPLARAQGVLYPEPLERVVLTRFETMSQTEVNRHDQLG